LVLEVGRTYFPENFSQKSKVKRIFVSGRKSLSDV